MKKFLKVFDPAKKKEVICGYTDKGTYYREVKNEHYMVKYKGYGIQEELFTELMDTVNKIEIRTQAGSIFKTTLANWVKKGKRAKFGHGYQIFLPVKEMELINVEGK